MIICFVCIIRIASINKQQCEHYTTNKAPKLQTVLANLPPNQKYQLYTFIYEGRTESHKQLFFACELGTVDEGECGGRWNQLLCYP